MPSTGAHAGGEGKCLEKVLLMHACDGAGGSIPPYEEKAWGVTNGVLERRRPGPGGWC